MVFVNSLILVCRRPLVNDIERIEWDSRWLVLCDLFNLARAFPWCCGTDRFMAVVEADVWLPLLLVKAPS